MLIELSSLLHENMLKWPTNPAERLEVGMRMEKGDVCNTSSVYHHMHNGTHVDAPQHFAKQGKGINEIPIEDFYYTVPCFLTLKKQPDEYITQDELAVFAEVIRKADILCLYSGFSDIKEKDPETYVHRFPSFTYEAALYLRTQFPKLKAVAIDFMSVDSATDGPVKGFLAHKAFLDELKGDNVRTLLLFEDVNLNRLAVAGGNARQICAFPIRWENAEAAPVCMVAFC